MAGAWGEALSPQDCWWGAAAGPQREGLRDGLDAEEVECCQGCQGAATASFRVQNRTVWG